MTNNKTSAEKFCLIIFKTKGADSDDVRWKIDEKADLKGYGFINRETKHISLIKCPDCGRENYAMNVMSGDCTWCPFKANNL